MEMSAQNYEIEGVNGIWLIPFKGRNFSCATNQNFLWKRGNIYIMDNHRAALWCWMKETNKSAPLNLYHIDAHYDCRNISNVELVESSPDISALTINDYLELPAGKIDGSTYPIITWDNIVSLFIALHKDRLGEFFTSTHQIGDTPNGIHYEEVSPHQLPDFFRQYIVDDGITDNWIIDIDLDYFFCQQAEQLSIMFSTSYIEEIFRAISDAYQSGRVAVITVCLSPECCGNWAQAEKLCYLLCEFLKVDFKLPPTE